MYEQKVKHAMKLKNVLSHEANSKGNFYIIVVRKHLSTVQA